MEMDLDLDLAEKMKKAPTVVLILENGHIVEGKVKSTDDYFHGLKCLVVEELPTREFPAGAETYVMVKSLAAVSFRRPVPDEAIQRQQNPYLTDLEMMHGLEGGQVPAGPYADAIAQARLKHRRSEFSVNDPRSGDVPSGRFRPKIEEN